MKKMGLLIALATVLTVGGVYATWTYADKAVETKTANIAVGVVESTATAAIGEIKVTGDMAFKIDQTASGNYHGMLIHDTTTSEELTLTFTPAAGAPASWADGVAFKYVLSINAGTYNSKAILVLDSTKAEKAEDNATDNTWTITKADILAAVSVNQEFTVPTSADYTTFTTAVTNTKPSITATVTCTATAA